MHDTVHYSASHYKLQPLTIKITLGGIKGLQIVVECVYIVPWFVKILSGRARKSRRYSPILCGLAGALQF